jgi:hypothetical protein
VGEPLGQGGAKVGEVAGHAFELAERYCAVDGERTREPVAERANRRRRANLRVAVEVDVDELGESELGLGFGLRLHAAEARLDRVPVVVERGGLGLEHAAAAVNAFAVAVAKLPAAGRKPTNVAALDWGHQVPPRL